MQEDPQKGPAGQYSLAADNTHTAEMVQCAAPVARAGCTCGCGGGWWACVGPKRLHPFAICAPPKLLELHPRPLRPTSPPQPGAMIRWRATRWRSPHPDWANTREQTLTSGEAQGGGNKPEKEDRPGARAEYENNALSIPRKHAGSVQRGRARRHAGSVRRGVHGREPSTTGIPPATCGVARRGGGRKHVCGGRRGVWRRTQGRRGGSPVRRGGALGASAETP